MASKKSSSKKSAGSSSSAAGSTGGGSSSTGGESKGGGTASVLRNIAVGAMGSDALLDIVERLGLVDLILGRVKSRIEETDLDELLDEATDYLRRNPEVLVVTLGAVTIATGLLVWLNNRREWDGTERRTTGTVSTSPGRVRRTTRVPDEYQEETE
jgi:hypothetical protein